MSLLSHFTMLLSLATTGILAAIPIPAVAHELDTPALEAIHTALHNEHKAWSTYNAILQNHGNIGPFSNIIIAEQRHADMLGELLIKYNQPIPQNPYETGTKAKPLAPNSLLEACEIGVEAEIENVALYDNKLLPMVKNYPDVEAVLVQLRDASGQRHLPASERCVSRGGVIGHAQASGRSRARQGQIENKYGDRKRCRD